jgi:hypothetical protein
MASGYLLDVVTQHHLDLDLCHRTICMLDLVLGQLLPYGIQWPSICDLLRSTTGGCMDDRLTKPDFGTDRIATPSSMAFDVYVLRSARSALNTSYFGQILMQPPRYHVIKLCPPPDAQYEATFFQDETLPPKRRIS